MKTIKNSSFIVFFGIICFLGGLTSCSEDLQLKTLPYLFRPVGFSATVNKTVVTIAWAAVDSAKSYTLQVSTDSLFGNKLVDTTTTKLSFTKEYAGETTFYARVRTNAMDSTKNSKFNNKFSDGTYSFKTPKENIFLGFGTSNNTGALYSAYMDDVKTLDIKWQPAANVTHLILLSADGTTKDSLVISSAEALAGEKVVGSLFNSTWKVEIFNSNILRGTTNGIIEGDIILSSGGDLVGALNSALSGQVILLASGAVYTVGSSSYSLSKNVKVRGFSASIRPVVCMTSGTPTASSNMLGFSASATLGSVKFENIDFTGFCDNNSGTGATKIGYLFNNGTAATVSNLTFSNCILRNFANTPMRLKNGVSQKIDTLAFNGCLITEVGFGGTYAVVNSNSADYFNTIIFSNCTVSNFKNGLILRTASAVPMTSINISNCTFNQGMQDPVATRYFIDANLTAFTGGINIKNNLFGSSGPMASGIRATIVPVNTGCYYTSDYFDDTLIGTTPPTSYSIKPAMTAYSGASTSLWNGPTTGDFTLKDTSFKGKGVAGDLRWY